MEESLTDPCICGHTRGMHEDVPFCWGFGLMGENCLKKCKNFKLDNLSYIEELAREKGLV